ncbi:hypothetical protein RFI_17027 [Reticulomyxa filosa]|uniref:Uncharacterized protein n=1 Tax=Reticulomyxa filosa TaxID=46433 RepID=X6N271_RETFI|nr:hypothetical protein RFI_17027 [Reticulomyxa filosa]|eukprot:ETO20191.1 hypothetical protein RFI_17027 [Reticulomyxa filosa]
MKKNEIVCIFFFMFFLIKWLFVNRHVHIKINCSPFPMTNKKNRLLELELLAPMQSIGKNGEKNDGKENGGEKMGGVVKKEEKKKEKKERNEKKKMSLEKRKKKISLKKEKKR